MADFPSENQIRNGDGGQQAFRETEPPAACCILLSVPSLSTGLRF